MGTLMQRLTQGGAGVQEVMMMMAVLRAERLKIERGHCIKKQRWREGWMDEGHKRRKIMVSWGHPQTEERKGRRAVIRKGVIII